MEIVAGTPTIVLAIFGLLIFSKGVFGFLSFTAEGGAVFGRSFFIAGIMMSLIALPLVVGVDPRGPAVDPRPRARGLLRPRQGQDLDDPPGAAARLPQGNRDGRDARDGTDRGRHGDRRHSARRLADACSKQGTTPLLGTLKGTGSTLTSYVYANSPAGEGNSPTKAYAAAFVLLMIVILMNFVVDLMSRQRSDPWAR